MSMTRRHCDAVRVDIQAGKAAALLGSQFVGIRLVDAELLQPAQHGRRELAIALLVRRAKSVEEFLIILLGFVHHARIQRRGSTGCARR